MHEHAVCVTTASTSGARSTAAPPMSLRPPRFARAMELDGHSLRGRELRVSYGQPKRT